MRQTHQKLVPSMSIRHSRKKRRNLRSLAIVIQSRAGEDNLYIMAREGGGVGKVESSVCLRGTE
jgi:hypothetical protein